MEANTLSQCPHTSIPPLNQQELEEHIKDDFSTSKKLPEKLAHSLFYLLIADHQKNDHHHLEPDDFQVWMFQNIEF